MSEVVYIEPLGVRAEMPRVPCVGEIISVETKSPSGTKLVKQPVERVVWDVRIYELPGGETSSCVPIVTMKSDAASQPEGEDDE